jgi:hypothetical protein
MTFQPGKSGNPAGKPAGARNKTTLAVEALLDGEAEALTRKAIELAKAGDMAALRLCMDRLAPPRKDRLVMFELPTITCAADAVKASAALFTAVAIGDLTPSEAAELGKLVLVNRAARLILGCGRNIWKDSMQDRHRGYA